MQVPQPVPGQGWGDDPEQLPSIDQPDNYVSLKVSKNMGAYCKLDAENRIGKQSRTWAAKHSEGSGKGWDDWTPDPTSSTAYIPPAPAADQDTEILEIPPSPRREDENDAQFNYRVYLRDQELARIKRLQGKK